MKETQEKEAQNQEQNTEETSVKDEKIVDINEAKEEPKEEVKEETEVEKLTRERDEYLNSLQRLQAEFTNYRKRMVKDKEDFRKYALETFAQEVLLILDNFERALLAAEANHNFDSLSEGIKLIEKQFVEWLGGKDIKAIDAMGKEFDPNFHQAMSHQETNDQPENTVVAQMQKGYTINDKVLRPALVVVAKPAEVKEAKEEK